MNSLRTLPILILAFTTFLPKNLLFARPAPQTKGSHSSDINAIGHRNRGKDVDFFSPDKEQKLGKALALEVERASRMVDDPIIAEYVNRIAQKIAKNSDAQFPITIRVIDSDVMDAFTLPGGPPLPERLQSMDKEIASILPQRLDAIVSSSEFQEIRERLRVLNLQKGLKPEGNHQKPILRRLADSPVPERQYSNPDCD